MYVKDDIDFFRHLPTTIGENDKLVTFDIVSLYTNIQVEFGIQAVQFCIEIHRSNRKSNLGPSLGSPLLYCCSHKVI